jgi:sortase A
VGISGHRTTYLAPFRQLDRLGKGDVIRLQSRWRTYTYRVTGRTYADPYDLDVFAPTDEPRLTLTTCHPPYSDRFRFVIRAILVSVARR